MCSGPCFPVPTAVRASAAAVALVSPAGIFLPLPLEGAHVVVMIVLLVVMFGEHALPFLHPC